MNIKRLEHYTPFEIGDFFKYENHILVVKESKTRCDRRCFFSGKVCPYFCESITKNFCFEEMSPIELMILEGSDLND